MGPRMPMAYEYEKVKPPKNFFDVGRYLKELLGGFFYRFFYIFGLVFKTGPWILFLMSFIALLSGVLPVISAVISKEILNELQGVYGVNMGMSALIGSTVFILIIWFFVCRVIRRVVQRLNSSIVRIAGEKVTRQVKVMIMEKARNLDISSFDLPNFYEQLENANREAGMRPVSIISSTFSVISTFIELISYIVILATAPEMWWIVPILVTVSIPSAIITFVYRRKNFSYMRMRSKDRRQMEYYSSVMVNKDFAKEIRIFDMSDTMIGSYDRVFKKYYGGLRRLIVNEGIWHVAIAIISSCVNCAFYVFIASKVFDGTIMLGDYTLYTGAIVSIASAVTDLISVSGTVYEGTLFIDNLIAFVKAKQTVVPILKEPLRPNKGAPHTIVFDNVGFVYPGSDHFVLRNVNLTFRPGETVVLVGVNGAGKTTLIKLLTRMYDPTEGRILIDGHDIREYDVKDLQSLFGTIFQDFGRYAFTVEENISFGNTRKPVDKEAVRAAAKQSTADVFIDKLADGYDTPLMRVFERNATELSTGQWQKIAVARAFYSDSDILILDEPTASLDAIAEQEIFDQFDRLRADKTTLFVSHRLSSATVASLIVVMDGGRVVETGTHKTLMENRGKYYELFTTQAKRYLEAEANE